MSNGELREKFIVFGTIAASGGDNVETEEELRPRSGSELSGSRFIVTPTSPSSTSTGGDTYSEARYNRPLSEIYNETQEIELEDEELMLSGTNEPTSYINAATERNWRKLTKLPQGLKAIDLRWVYKAQKNTNGEIVKYKNRIIAKGSVQKQGRDFDENFAPLTRLEIIRILLALAVKYGWEVHNLDVKSAFLNEKIQEEVYVTQSENLLRQDKNTLCRS